MITALIFQNFDKPTFKKFFGLTRLDIWISEVLSNGGNSNIHGCHKFSKVDFMKIVHGKFSSEQTFENFLPATKATTISTAYKNSWHSALYLFDIVCCNVLQCALVCCSVLQCAAVCCSVLQYVAVCCSVLQCVVVCCSVLQCVAVCCSVLRCVSVCCSVLQCAAVCCSVL